MKLVRLGILLLATSALSFAANKEMVQLQRDVAIMQDQIRTLQRTLDEKLAALTVLAQQTQDNSSKANSSVSGLQDVVSRGISSQLGPVMNVGTKVDSMGDEVRSLKDSLVELDSKLQRLDGKVTDLGNQFRIMQSPPAAPGAPGAPNASIDAPGNATPPSGMTAAKAYADAYRDKEAGNLDLALKEFQDYLQYYGNTERAPNAQYYVGEIYYQRSDMENAIKSFDLVLERFPENSKTPDAHYMKGMALLKSSQRNRAVQEFRALTEKYPRTDLARKAQAQLRALGLSTSSRPKG